MFKSRFFQIFVVFALASAGSHVASAAEDFTSLDASANVEAYASITDSTGLDCGTINYTSATCAGGYTPASVTFDVQGVWELTITDDAVATECNSDPATGVTVSHQNGDAFCILLSFANGSGEDGGEGLSSQIDATGFYGLTADDDTGAYSGSFTVTLSAL